MGGSLLLMFRSRQFFKSSLKTHAKHMGSTPDGIASPMTQVGCALPQDTEIDRDGGGRVRGDGRS
jgi:hypothetical protein